MKAIITGGSSGLGFELAKQLRERNCDIILIGRDSGKLRAASEKLQSVASSAAVGFHAFDIADEAAVTGFFDILRERREPITYLFNVAGKSYYGKIEEINQAVIMDTLRANLIGLTLMTAQGVRHMKDFPCSGQRIVSVLSTAALAGKKHETLYNAAKWGARGFLESVRDELANEGIEVINIYPGGMQTPFWEKSTSGYPVHTFMKPEAVAKQIAAISTDYNTLITEVTIKRPKQS